MSKKRMFGLDLDAVEAWRDDAAWNPPDLKRRLCSEEDAGSNFKWRIMTDWSGIDLGLELGGSAEDGGLEAGRGWRLGLADALAGMSKSEFHYPVYPTKWYVGHLTSHIS